MFQNQDYSYRGANFIHFAITISNPLTFQMCLLYLLHTFLTHIFSKINKPTTFKTFSLIQHISIEIKSTPM
jgi:hypothetical protein